MDCFDCPFCVRRFVGLRMGLTWFVGWGFRLVLRFSDWFIVALLFWVCLCWGLID